MSAIELKSGDRTVPVKIIKKDGNDLHISLGEKKYHLNLVKVENNIYSILLDGKSYDVEVVATEIKNRYSARYLCHPYSIEVLDAETRYMRSRLNALGESEENIVSCPMPGKIVRIPVNAGDSVTAGEVVIVVAAMKMESEYKTGKTGVIKEILVKEGDVIEANMPLIILE
ncbi:MAG: hypothetical protein EA408_13385 [Marinilabiliales bacterium]|nr:MAG: hypothetical protein EA408_13385 [Marinilabiliales bacterium]